MYLGFNFKTLSVGVASKTLRILKLLLIKVLKIYPILSFTKYKCML